MIKNNPFLIKKDFYRGYKYYVGSNIQQYRCGYVVIPKDHPWHGKHYKDINAILNENNVHGKLTFSGFEELEQEYIIGFDCAHINDLPDKSLYKLEGMIGKLAEITTYRLRELESIMSEMKPGKRTIKTTEFVEEECKKLIDLTITHNNRD